jgi:hypothetical protein
VITRALYAYSYDNPLTHTDPLGLWPREGLVRGAIDVIAVGPYAAYYLNYEAARAINHVGEQLGPAGSVLSHVVAAPLLVPQLESLTVDASIDALKGQLLLKGQLFGGESICDEGVRGSINPLHSFLPSWLQGPEIFLPGLNHKGSVEVEW